MAGAEAQGPSAAAGVPGRGREKHGAAGREGHIAHREVSAMTEFGVNTGSSGPRGGKRCSGGTLGCGPEKTEFRRVEREERHTCRVMRGSVGKQESGGAATVVTLTSPGKLSFSIPCHVNASHEPSTA
eukprot:gene12415-15607_t